MNEIITILIPTYNRKEQLGNVLKQLEIQTNQHFKVVISNNASCYPIESLLVNLSKEFVNKIEIYNRKFNVGLDINVLEGLCLCDTKYVWILSDDEFVKEDAIEIIYKWIGKIPEFGCLNFTLTDRLKFNDDVLCMKSIQEFINAYGTDKELHGDLIFLSNKVIDWEKIQSCIEEGLKYVYTRLPMLVIYERMLEKNIPLVCINENIVNYNSISPRSWRIYEVILGSRTLNDITYNVSDKQRKSLLYIFSFNIRYVYYLWFVEGTELRNEKEFFDQIYHGIYKYCLPMSKRIPLRVVSYLSKWGFGYMICKSFFSFRFGDSLLAKKIKRLVKMLRLG